MTKNMWINQYLLKPSLDLGLVPTTYYSQNWKTEIPSNIDVHFSRGKILQRMREHDMRLSRTLNQNWTFRCYQQPPFWGSLVDIHITFFCIGIYINTYSPRFIYIYIFIFLDLLIPNLIWVKLHLIQESPNLNFDVSLNQMSDRAKVA